MPFYFCPRSVMLYTISQGNVAESTRRQEDIIHLRSTVEAAIGSGRSFVFTDRHAEPPDAKYSVDPADLADLRWEIIDSNSWGGDERRPYKQAEFLVHRRFAWELVEEIGVYDQNRKATVEAALAGAGHTPVVAVRRSWYY